MDLKKLSTIEKTKLVMGADFWCNETLGGRVYKFVVSDGPVGLRQPTNRNTTEQTADITIHSIAYPSIQVLSQTWNKDIAKLMGKSIANDCIEQNVDVVLGPGVNIKRNPLNGRNFEYFSEDPYLAGTMAREYIYGVQSMNVGTCLKHYCCNNSEFSRHWASMEVDERTLREIYLKPFQIACEAKPWSVMCSYNLVNGRRMSENGKLYDILKNEFGFSGMIISDWGAVKDSEASMNAGLSLEMPYEQAHHDEMMEKAEKGLLDSEKLDKAAGEVLSFAEKCESTKKIRKMDMSVEERRMVSEKIAEEGIVLLKNENHLLPIRKGSKVAVTGAPAKTYYFGDGSSHVVPESEPINLTDALNEVNVHAKYYDSIWEKKSFKVNVSRVSEGLNGALESDYTVLTVGNDNECETEAYDRAMMKLTNEEEIVIHHFAKVTDKLIVVIEAGSPIDMSDWIDEVAAVVYMGYGGQLGHKALAKILVGDINPSGKLSETFPLHLEDTPSYNTYQDGLVMVYSEGLNVGYRYYETYNKPVLFPFGYGLSYSEFAYTNLEIEEENDGYLVSFDIENTSEVDGKEVAELYVRELVPEVYRPKSELKEYTKVEIKAHEKVHVSMKLKRDAFSYYSVAYDSDRIKPGMFEIMIGKNAHQIVLSKNVLVK